LVGSAKRKIIQNLPNPVPPFAATSRK